MSNKKLIKSTGVIGFATSISRVLGFVRDIVIANFFGTALYAQAFVVAFRIPNLLRDLIGEGAANAAIVPVLTQELARKGRGDFFRLAQVLFNILFWALVVFTVFGMMASPLIVRLIAPGFIGDYEKFITTVSLTRILFPFLILVGMWAYAMGVLNTLGHFASPAFGPCILNLSMIICASLFGENVFGLASGVLIGGVFQFLIQLPPLYKNGWRLRFTGDFSHPQAKKAGILLVPRALGACVYQVNVFVSTILASLSTIAGEGAVAALYYANRVWQLPLAIFGIAIAQAALPTMSKHAAMNDMEQLKNTLVFSIKAVFFILTPATVGLVILSEPITKVLFERGAFTQYSTGITSSALLFYAIGLLACGGTKVLVSAFYSLHDTMTPVKTALFSLVMNIALNIALMYPLKVGGLALATSISSVFNFIALYFLLSKRLGGLGIRRIYASLFKVILASIMMGVTASVMMIFLPDQNAITLFTEISASIAVFGIAVYLLGVEEVKEFLKWISRKR